MEKNDLMGTRMLREELTALDNRIAALESAFESLKTSTGHGSVGTLEVNEAVREMSSEEKAENSVEFNIGEYGMAWLGNIVLLFAMIFFFKYLQNKGMGGISILAGVVVVSVIYYVSFLTRNTFSLLSRLFSYNGHLILFFTALNLHFFQAAPIVKSPAAGILILFAVTTALLILAWIRRSQVLAGTALLMILITGIISNVPDLIAGTSSVVAIISVFLYYRFGWIKPAFLNIFLVYLAFLFWMLNNPVMGNTIGIIQSPGAGLWFVLAAAMTYSLLALIPVKEGISDDMVLVAIVTNGLGFTVLLAMMTLSFYVKSYVPLFSVISVFCLVYSFLLKSKSELKITSSMYAIYGFMAMSVAFYGIYLLPRAYLFLSVQSLLVVSFALWFRSRFIVVINALMFVGLLIFYLKDTASYNGVNFSFMLVAFITARIINWKKERLNIKTEMLRNTYLIVGFLMTLIAFSHAFPKSFITVSWIGGAILFIIMSLILRNIKYRWLAIAAVVASAFRLVFIDMSNFDIGYRVFVLLLLAIISIAVSVLYTRFIKKRKYIETA